MKKVKVIRCNTSMLSKKESVELVKFINSHNILEWKQSGDIHVTIYTFIYEDQDN